MPRRSFPVSAAAEPAAPVSLFSGLAGRLRAARRAAGLDQKALAEVLGVTANAVSNWEQERARPDPALIPALCDALGISLYQYFALEDPDLLSREERALLRDYRSLSPEDRTVAGRLVSALRSARLAESCPALIRARLVGKSLSAGIGDPSEFDGACTPLWLYDDPGAPRGDYVFTVNGDSMEPEYHDGDRVLVRRAEGAGTLRPGQVGAFISGSEQYIKVYQKDGLHSLNPQYPPLRFPADDTVYLIGAVTGRLEDERIAAEEDVRLYQQFHPEDGKGA